MTEPLSTKQLSEQLYAELESKLGVNWRSEHISFDAAVHTAGSGARSLCLAWRASFAKRTDRKLAASDRAAKVENAPEVAPEAPTRQDDDAVADKGKIGRYTQAERRDTIGAELHATDVGDDEAQHRGAALGFKEDSLYHPDGRLPAFKYHDIPLHWDPKPPRESSAIHC